MLGVRSKFLKILQSDTLCLYFFFEYLFLSITPIIEIIGLEGNSAILRDKKLDRIVEVYLHQKELKCMNDNSKDCIHVGFCYALPQIKKIQ